MDDLISRKQAIEVVQNRHMMLSKEKVLLINDLEKLPSAQPTFDARDTQYNLPIGTDLISRAEAIDALLAWMSDPEDDRKSAFDVLKQLPSAQPEISMDQIKIWLDAWEGYVDKDIIARMKYRVIDIPFVQTREETT